MSFKFKSVHALRQDLGQYDAICQLTEISVRDFLENSKSTASLSEYITARSLVYNINTNHVNADILSNRLALQYIVSVQQYAEYFLYEFRKEYEILFNYNIELGDSNDSLLDKIIDKLPGSKEELIENCGEINFKLISYYRSIRNKYCHYYKISDRSIEELFDNLKPFIPQINDSFSLNDAPNEYNKINFNDFMLFTRALKYFAHGICSYINPSEEVFIQHLNAIKFKHKIKNNKARYQEAIRTYLRSNYGITNFDVDKIYNALVA